MITDNPTDEQSRAGPDSFPPRAILGGFAWDHPGDYRCRYGHRGGVTHARGEFRVFRAAIASSCHRLPHRNPALSVQRAILKWRGSRPMCHYYLENQTPSASSLTSDLFLIHLLDSSLIAITRHVGHNRPCHARLSTLKLSTLTILHAHLRRPLLSDTVYQTLHCGIWLYEIKGKVTVRFWRPIGRVDQYLHLQRVPEPLAELGAAS